LGFADFDQPSFSDKAENRALGPKGNIIVELQGGLQVDRVAIDQERAFPGQILDPVLVLAEEDLGMMFHNGRVFKAEMAFGTPAY